jgi:dihydroorotase-like cyclic amidohydrolase
MQKKSRWSKLNINVLHQLGRLTNNEHLWQALKNGVIDFVATDHSPATPDLKQMDTGNL